MTSGSGLKRGKKLKSNETGRKSDSACYYFKIIILMCGRERKARKSVCKKHEHFYYSSISFVSDQQEPDQD